VRGSGAHEAEALSDSPLRLGPHRGSHQRAALFQIDYTSHLSAHNTHTCWPVRALLRRGFGSVRFSTRASASAAAVAAAASDVVTFSAHFPWRACLRRHFSRPVPRPLFLLYHCSLCKLDGWPPGPPSTPSPPPLPPSPPPVSCCTVGVSPQCSVFLAWCACLEHLCKPSRDHENGMGVTGQWGRSFEGDRDSRI
jgi:hypothetical protein